MYSNCRCIGVGYLTLIILDLPHQNGPIMTLVEITTPICVLASIFDTTFDIGPTSIRKRPGKSFVDLDLNSSVTVYECDNEHNS